MNRVVAVILLASALFSAPVKAGPGPKASMLENSLLCLRVDRLTDDFASRFQSFLPTNPVAGMVLDLRFADGDATAATNTLKLFTDAKKPLVVLVNSQTRGGAAATARELRAAGLGLLIGSTNAADAVVPDILVDVAVADERKYVENPFANLTTTNAEPSATVKNQLAAFVDHTTEAELVRQRIKDNDEIDEAIVTQRPLPAQPVIRDPALARAVDLLKAITALKLHRG